MSDKPFDAQGHRLITDEMVKAGAKAAAEAAGFCWDNCAQSQWERDMRAGLEAALGTAGADTTAYQDGWNVGHAEGFELGLNSREVGTAGAVEADWYCPFCKSVDGPHVYTVENFDEGSARFEKAYVECEECGAQGPACASDAEAAAKWKSILAPSAAVDPATLELADRLWKLATAPTIAPSSVYANICREAALALRTLAYSVPSAADQTTTEALRHAEVRFQCLSDHFKEIGDEALWAMSEVDAERMQRALSRVSSTDRVLTHEKGE